MSAFVVSKAHIDRLVALALYGPQDQGGPSYAGDATWEPIRWYSEDPSSLRGDTGQNYFRHLNHITRHAREVGGDGIGSMLLAANIRSIEARYPDTVGHPENRPGWDGEPDAYSFPVLTEHVTVAEGLRAISCFEYQACEFEGWLDSEAHSFCDSMRDALCHVITRTATRGWDNWDRPVRQEAVNG